MKSEDAKTPIGPCAACKKEHTTSRRCLACLKFDIEVFYCNRDCQLKHWKIHKPKCKMATNLSNEELMKLNRRIQKSTICTNCSRSNFEIGSKMSVCSKCNVTGYCSRMCQTAHWPKHKSMCKVIVAERKMLDRVMDSEEQTFAYSCKSGVKRQHFSFYPPL